MAVQHPLAQRDWEKGSRLWIHRTLENFFNLRKYTKATRKKKYLIDDIYRARVDERITVMIENQISFEINGDKIDLTICNYLLTRKNRTVREGKILTTFTLTVPRSVTMGTYVTVRNYIRGPAPDMLEFLLGSGGWAVTEGAPKPGVERTPDFGIFRNRIGPEWPIVWSGYVEKLQEEIDAMNESVLRD